MSRASILREISAERDRQDAKWGATSADHVPNGTGPDVHDPIGRALAMLDPDVMRPATFAELAEVRKRICGSGSSFANILLEEVFEALAESDPFDLYKELKEVAAVCVKWMEKLDRVEFAVPDAGGELAEVAIAREKFGPLIAAPKEERCNKRTKGGVCVLKKGEHPYRLHRAAGILWAQEDGR